MSRNCSRQNLKEGNSNEESEDLTKARDRAGQEKVNLKKQRDALKADIMKLKAGGKKSAAGEDKRSYDSEDELANTNASNFTIQLGKCQQSCSR